MNRSTFTIALTMTLLIYSGGVLADKLPKHYPESFQHIGQIDDMRNNIIIIDDSMLSLAPSTQVHTPRARFATLKALKKGLRVGFSTTRESGSNTAGKITEIWVLPTRFKMENLE